jgi:hypothetical protein
MEETKGGVYGDAEDYTRMNGQPLFTNLTLADMIRDYMKKEKEREMGQDMDTSASI